MHHIEYWRFYQSTQFIHLFVVEEVINPDWAAQLRAHAAPGVSDSDAADVLGYFSVDNFLYTTTEIFEFAARLTSGGLYQHGLSISIELKGIKDFALSFSSDRTMLRRYQTTVDNLGNKWDFTPNTIISAASDSALEAVLWFFERFGWLKPPKEVFRKDIQNYLAGKW